MPGSVSDSYDPEWGTGENSDTIRNAMLDMHCKLSDILGGMPPMYILDLVQAELGNPITATLTEKQWRLLRFACERAAESI